jgi:hypothetical protein
VAAGVPTFEVLLFVSAKLFYLEPVGLITRWDTARSLHEILLQIADALGDVDLAGASFQEEMGLLKKTLSRRRTLLIVDNLETVENPLEVISFLYDLPPSVKVVITTREQVLFVPVRLTSMVEQDELSMIRHEAEEKGVLLGDEASQSLYRATGGIPVAIRYAMGQLAMGDSLEEVLQGLAQADGDIARFCFDHSLAPLRG